ncbi:MAG TPA: vWA domain-containing protein [Candidatus Acidoferrum sp.]|nr:vWA domain-containing protein [Candidatus Acidoferrum sp.]
MKNAASLAILAALVSLGQGPTRALAAGEEGVALAIIYDTSGSMRDTVPDATGHRSPKFRIANRALKEIASQVQTFATNTAGGPPRTVQAGLWVFNGDSARQAVKFGPFDAAALVSFADRFSQPSGNTPLGNALKLAGQAVLDSPLPHKHVLIITDGMNTAGPPPEETLPALKGKAEAKGTSLSVHFVAFDTDAKVFSPVKKQGATVVSASDEKQLNTQLEFIMQRKILLEEEEPKR